MSDGATISAPACAKATEISASFIMLASLSMRVSPVVFSFLYELDLYDDVYEI